MAKQEQLEVTEVEAAPALTIHDQAYWDQDLEQLGERFDEVNVGPLNHMDQYQTAQFMDFIWSSVLRYREVVQQIALEAVPKTRTRATRVPKAALPESDASAAQL